MGLRYEGLCRPGKRNLSSLPLIREESERRGKNSLSGFLKDVMLIELWSIWSSLRKLLWDQDQSPANKKSSVNIVQFFHLYLSVTIKRINFLPSSSTHRFSDPLFQIPPACLLCFPLLCVSSENLPKKWAGGK